MSDDELNRAAAELMGWEVWNDWFWTKPGTLTFWRMKDWSPATKTEHAWIVQQACDPQLFAIALRKLRPAGEWEDEWLATAPPRARTEAAVAVLSQQAEGKR